MTPCVDLVMTVLPGEEGDIQWLYLDGGGNPTCGIGHLVATVEESLKLPWEVGSNQATRLEVAADFDSIKRAPKGHTAGFYQGLTVCRVALGWSLQDAAGRLEKEFLPPLREMMKAFDDIGNGDFNSYPVPAQAALLDMAYNMGIGVPGCPERPGKKKSSPPIPAVKATGLHGFGKMLTAVAMGEWGVAANECHRQGIQPSRNEWTKQKFLGCVSTT